MNDIESLAAEYWDLIVNFWSQNAGRYLMAAVTIVLVLIGAKIVVGMVNKVIHRAMRPNEDADNYELRKARAETLEPLVMSVMRYVLYFVALLIVLQQVGVDTTALLASAGVLGLAVGFGAQNTVKDFLAGFFLIFDGLIRVGDVITVGDTTGLVERIDLRNTMMREFNGRLWSIPNGDVRSFGNFNRGWCRAIANVGMAYEQDVENGMKALREVAEKWAADFPDMVVEPPEVQGVMGLDDSSVGLRIIAKVKPMGHWETERELRRRIKDHFDRQAVEIPFPRRVVYHKKDE